MRALRATYNTCVYSVITVCERVLADGLPFDGRVDRGVPPCSSGGLFWSHPPPTPCFSPTPCYTAVPPTKPQHSHPHSCTTLQPPHSCTSLSALQARSPTAPRRPSRSSFCSVERVLTRRPNHSVVGPSAEHGRGVPPPPYCCDEECGVEGRSVVLTERVAHGTAEAGVRSLGEEVCQDEEVACLELVHSGVDDHVRE